MDKLLYGDFEEQYTDYETAEIAILPVPYDGTSTWLKGADKGPHVLVADVTYDNEGYMIEAVKEGSTLFNKDGTAHRKVNSWTANLTVTIREEENKILLRQTN